MGVRTLQVTKKDYAQYNRENNKLGAHIMRQIKKLQENATHRLDGDWEEIEYELSKLRELIDDVAQDVRYIINR